MTMEVRGPNGIVVNFPDGTDPATINKVMQEAAAKSGAMTAAPQRPPEEPYSGQLLPFSKDAQGNVSFDANAGILAPFTKAATYFDDAVHGRVDPKSDAGIAGSAALAGIVTPMSAASRAGLGWAGAAVKQSAVKPKVPSAAELLDTGGFGFNMARGMDVRYTPQSVQNLAMKLKSDLFRAGFRESNAPKVFAELDALTRTAEPGAFATIDDLHAVRMALGKASRPAADGSHANEAEAARRVIDALDGFITRPDPKAVVAGDAAAAGNVWADAMGNYAAGKRSDRLTAKEDAAELQAAVSNSGKNIDNRIRAVAAAILKSDRLRAGYSAEELTMMRGVAEGTATRNRIRDVGNLLGGGGGLGAFVTGMASGTLTGTTSPMLLGTATVGTGVAAKALGNWLTKNALRKVDTETRKRSPLYQEKAANPDMAPASSALRMAPVRAGGAAVPQPQMTPEMYDDYLRRKYAPQQGA